MYGLTGFTTLQQYLFPDPKAVNGPGTVLLIMLPSVTGILVFVLFVVALFWWRAERKLNTNSHDLVLTDEGINFLNRTEKGFVKWSTYENYLENRWCFIIWNRKTLSFFMFPKRLFPTEADQARCRQLLQTNLKPSRWFFL